MSKNLIPEICKLLNVELGEEFKIKHFDELTYSFGGDGLKAKFDNRPKTGWTTANTALGGLLSGKMEIVKLPWKPKKGEDYYTFGCVSEKWEVIQQTWINHPFDLALINKDWIYRTKAEAQAALPKMATEFGMEYKL